MRFDPRSSVQITSAFKHEFIGSTHQDLLVKPSLKIRVKVWPSAGPPEALLISQELNSYKNTACDTLFLWLWHRFG